MRKKQFFIVIIIFILVSCIIVGCNSNGGTTSPKDDLSSIPSDKGSSVGTTSSKDDLSSVSSDDSSSYYSVSEEIKPKVIEDSVNYKDTYLEDLSKKINYSAVGEICFLDDKNIIFSVSNNKNDYDYPTKNADLFKYNIETNVLSLLCPEYTLYYGDSVSVKDSNNFSITSRTHYLSIKENKVEILRDIFSEAKKKYVDVTSAFYNENNNKILILENILNKNNAYIVDNQLNNPKKLPFKNIYRVQWADKDTILVAYKESIRTSVIATYNLHDESVKITRLKEGIHFIDPIVFDNNIVRFLYHDEPHGEAPWGFLDLNKGVIDLILFESCNPMSMVSNNRMVGFSNTNQNYMSASKLFLYDNDSKTMTIRNSEVYYPIAVAVSPDGKKIIYSSSDGKGGECKFYLNIKKD